MTFILILMLSLSNCERRITVMKQSVNTCHCAWHVHYDTQEGIASRLWEIPSDMPFVSLIYVYASCSCAQVDGEAGGPPSRHPSRVQAGAWLQRQCMCSKWFIQMVLREGRRAVITFTDYGAAFDTGGGWR